MNLTREYDVSRETIRKALLLLLENGYIHKIQGKGSIVLDVHRYRLPVTGLLSFKERRQFQDVEATTKVIVNEEVDAPDFMCAFWSCETWRKTNLFGSSENC